MLCLYAYKAVPRRCPLGLLLSKDGPRPVLRPRTRRACSSIQSRVSDVASYTFDRSKAGLLFRGHILGKSNVDLRDLTPCRALSPRRSPPPDLSRDPSHQPAPTILSPLHLNDLLLGRIASKKLLLFLYSLFYICILECLSRRQRHNIFEKGFKSAKTLPLIENKASADIPNNGL